MNQRKYHEATFAFNAATDDEFEAVKAVLVKCCNDIIEITGEYTDLSVSAEYVYARSKHDGK